MMMIMWRIRGKILRMMGKRCDEVVEPRQYSLVMVDPQNSCDLDKHSVFIYLGEIPNMSGHCVIIDQENNNILTGYHIENFIELGDFDI